MTRHLGAIGDIKDERIIYLKECILRLQDECEHEWGPEWQTYNIYKKRCKNCGRVHETEY